MAEETKIIATIRELSGSANSRRLRREGFVPGVVYNENAEAQQLQINAHDFFMMLRRHASDSLIADLVVGDAKALKVLIKDIQRDPVSGDIIHVDFQAISMTKKMRSRIHVALKGDSVGVEMQGGVLEYLSRDVEVECLPLDLIEELEVDISALKVGDSFLVSDLIIDPKLVVLTAGDVAIVSISAPRVEADPVDEGAAGGEAAAEDKKADSGGSDKK